MITRELLLSGDYLDSFKDLPGQRVWSAQQIEASMHEALAHRDPTQPVWLFAYGSLIWNPSFHYEEMQRAILPGWHRSFCVRLIDGRANAQVSGRMLALQAGGETTGMVLRLDEDKLTDELLLVWTREMVHGLYSPVWTHLQLADGRNIQTLTFVADTAHKLYEVDSSIATTSKIIARANGHLGSNRDYLMQLENTLERYDLHDDHIRELAAAVRALPEEMRSP